MRTHQEWIVLCVNSRGDDCVLCKFTSRRRCVVRIFQKKKKEPGCLGNLYLKHTFFFCLILRNLKILNRICAWVHFNLPKHHGKTQLLSIRQFAATILAVCSLFYALIKLQILKLSVWKIRFSPQVVWTLILVQCS